MTIALGRNILAPSFTRAPEYDTNRRDTGSYAFTCPTCGGDVSIAFTDLIDSAWNYERVLDAALLERARERFDIGIVGKAHDGGFVSLRRLSCPTCAAAYLVYAGVREPSSGWYQVTVQGIVELSPDEEAPRPMRGKREAGTD